VAPYIEERVSLDVVVLWERVVRCGGGGARVLTERSSMLSSLCLGTIVTCSISHRKATSEGTSPGGRGSAMLCVEALGYDFWRWRACM
jgi:hypothetical protein